MSGFSAFFAGASLIILAACATTGPQTERSAAFSQSISVVDIIDGDTIKIQNQITGALADARLVGYDTPETFEPGCAAELQLGQKATRRLQVLLARAGEITITQLGTDRYDRQLLRLNIDGRDLTAIMVSEGLAVPYGGGRRIDWCQKLAAT